MKKTHLGIAVLFLMGAAGAGSLSAPPGGQADGGKPAAPAPFRWPLEVVRPWDEAAVRPSAWSDALNAACDLRLRGRAGQEHLYRIWRQNVAYDQYGRPFSATVSSAECRHTLLRETGPGRWVQKIAWESFAYGESSSPGGEPKARAFEKARGIAYEYDPATFDPLNPPGDFGRLGEPLAAYALKVLGMDTAMFDSLPLAFVRPSGDGVGIGVSAGSAGPASTAAIGKGGTGEVSGSYGLAGSTVSVAGLTRCLGQPCALILYSSEGNSIKQDMGSGPGAMRMEGTEYFRGSMAVSLLDGHVVAGELSGFIPMVMAVPGQAPTASPVLGVLQQVSLREVPRL